jgi:hypothetical protein
MTRSRSAKDDQSSAVFMDGRRLALDRREPQTACRIEQKAQV